MIQTLNEMLLGLFRYLLCFDTYTVFYSDMWETSESMYNPTNNTE